VCEAREADVGHGAASDVRIHISHIASGECLAKVDCHADSRWAVTALSYNEARGDLVVGDEAGRIRIWSN